MKKGSKIKQDKSCKSQLDFEDPYNLKKQLMQQQKDKGLEKPIDFRPALSEVKESLSFGNDMYEKVQEKILSINILPEQAPIPQKRFTGKFQTMNEANSSSMNSSPKKQLTFTSKKSLSSKSEKRLSKHQHFEDDIMGSYFESTLKEFFGQDGSDGLNHR